MFHVTSTRLFSHVVHSSIIAVCFPSLHFPWIFVSRVGATYAAEIIGGRTWMCPYGLPELISVALVVILHLLRGNTLLSILSGTICYMILVQVVFAGV